MRLFDLLSSTGLFDDFRGEAKDSKSSRRASMMSVCSFSFLLHRTSNVRVAFTRLLLLLRVCPSHEHADKVEHRQAVDQDVSLALRSLVRGI